MLITDVYIYIILLKPDLIHFIWSSAHIGISNYSLVIIICTIKLFYKPFKAVSRSREKKRGGGRLLRLNYKNRGGGYSFSILFDRKVPHFPSKGTTDPLYHAVLRQIFFQS